MRDDADRTTGGRLFQARDAATGNDWSRKVDLLTGGTMRDVVTDERRWRPPYAWISTCLHSANVITASNVSDYKGQARIRA